MLISIHTAKTQVSEALPRTSFQALQGDGMPIGGLNFLSQPESLRAVRRKAQFHLAGMTSKN